MDEEQKICHALNTIMEKNSPQTHVDFQKVKNFGEKLLSTVGKLDIRFCVDHKFVGSWPSETAIFANECDIVIPVRIQGKLETTSNPEYVKFRPSGHSIDIWRDCIDFEGFLNPGRFSDTFYNLVERAFHGSTQKHVNMILRGKGAVATTLVYFIPDSHETSIDLVPIITVDREKGRSSKTVEIPGLEKHRDMPLELVAKSNVSEESAWRLSFSCFETDLINRIVETHATFRKLLIIYKLICRFYLLPKEDKTFPKRLAFTPVLKSYHFKVLLLNEYKEFSDLKHWTEEKLATRFLSILQRFKNCVSNEFLPHFILEKVNLLNYGFPRELILHHELFTNTASFMEKMMKTSFLK